MLCLQVFSAGETAAILSASAHGLGQHWDRLDQSSKEGFQKVPHTQAS